MKKKTEIPEWCKKDCKFRDEKAKYMPACQFSEMLEVRNDICYSYKKCHSYKKQEKEQIKKDMY